jgi:alkyl hydroperoxide reductase subunit AhpC
MSNGCSIDEFLRLTQALQTTYANKAAAPGAWQSGDK